MTPPLKERPPRRMKPHTPRWWKLAAELALSYAPPIKPCRDCGGPVLHGYCCDRCGSVEP